MKNHEKNQAKQVIKKNIEKCIPGGPRIDPKWLTIHRKFDKNRKKCQKNTKIEESIFDHFFEWPKNRKPRHDHHWKSELPISE